jgi:hypothetical protein
MRIELRGPGRSLQVGLHRTHVHGFGVQVHVHAVQVHGFGVQVHVHGVQVHVHGIQVHGFGLQVPCTVCKSTRLIGSRARQPISWPAWSP